MDVIIKKTMQTENRRTPLHAVHAPLGIFRPTHVNRSDEPMEEGYARALLPALQKAMYLTSFGRRTAHESRIEELLHVEAPQKLDK